VSGKDDEVRELRLDVQKLRLRLLKERLKRASGDAPSGDDLAATARVLDYFHGLGYAVVPGDFAAMHTCHAPPPPPPPRRGGGFAARAMFEGPHTCMEPEPDGDPEPPHTCMPPPDPDPGPPHTCMPTPDPGPPHTCMPPPDPDPGPPHTCMPPPERPSAA
jgi:hypothetical protein